jgi:N,N-dimethylformamidase
MKILGYPAELCYRPGEIARFMVSTDDIYDAQLVRIVCGDARENGPGFSERVIDACRHERIPGRKQETEIGSYMMVAPDSFPPLTEIGLIFNIYPTTPTKGQQTLVARWNDRARLGFRLSIDAESCLVAEIGDGNGKNHILTLPAPVAAREWLTIAFGLEPGTGRMTLASKPVDALFPRVEAASVTDRSGLVMAAIDPLPMTFAAFGRGRAEKPTMAGFYNGRMETPVLLARCPTLDDIESYQNTGPAVFTDAVAIWDFGRDFASSSVSDSRGGALNARLVNLPSRGVTASRWNGAEQNFKDMPAHYNAIHFHDDDLEDCAWDESFSFHLPNDLASGFYAAKIVAPGHEHHVVFMVEERPGTHRSDIAFLASSVTYVVYSNQHYDFDDPNMEMKNGVVTTFDPSDLYLNEHRELGMSPYDRHSDGYGVFYSSARRPLFSMHVKDKVWALNADTHITDWLEARKLKYDMITDHSVHADGLASLSRYRVVITGTHPEYWTTPMWRAMTRYLADGGRLMYLGGNGFYWRTAMHPDKPWLIELRRVESGARYWESEPGEGYMNFTGEYGGLWRRAAVAPQRLVGVGTVATGFDYSSYYRRRPESADPRVRFVFQGVGGEILGDYGNIGGGAAGLEIDRADPWLGTPPHALILARSVAHTRHYNVVPEETAFHHPTINGEEAEKCFADMVFFETANGGAVFSTGSIGWATSLAHNKYDNDISRITENVVRRFADSRPFPAPGPGSGSKELLRTRTDQGQEIYQGIDRKN